jgi:hypothetical protein
MRNNFAFGAPFAIILSVAGCATETAPPRPLSQGAIQCGQNSRTSDGIQIVFEACPSGFRPSHITVDSLVGAMDRRPYGGGAEDLVVTTVLNPNNRLCQVAKLARWEDGGQRLRVTTQMAMPIFNSAIGIAMQDGACRAHSAGSIRWADVQRVGNWRHLD